MQKSKRRINYCLIGDDGVPRIVFIIKLHNGNFYFINNSHLKSKFEVKISYHTPRPLSFQSQVHIKINNIIPNIKPSLNPPANTIKEVRPLGGGGCPIYLLSELPEAKEGSENRIIDVRPFHLSHLSSIQWYCFLVPVGGKNLLEKHPVVQTSKKSEFSEMLLIDYVDDLVPWIATKFTRIRDENPIWYKSSKG